MRRVVAFGIVLLAAAGVRAQERRVTGTLGFGGAWIDETGDRTLSRERADLFEGFSVRDVSLHALAPGSVKLDLFAPRIDPVARDVQLRVASPIASGSIRTASNDFIYDSEGALRSQRDLLTADLRIRPVRHVELFGEHARADLGGRRQAIVAGDEGELGTSWDEDTATWRGGLRLDGWQSTLELASLGRTFESRVVPDADRTLHGFEAALRSRPHRRVDAEGLYAWSRTRLLADGTPLQSDRVSARADVEVRPGLRVGPIGRYEESTDYALGVRNYMWALGGAVRAQSARGWGDLEGEWGMRDASVGDSDVWGVRAAGGADVGRGVRLQGVYQRRERDRQGIAAPVVPAAPLPGLVGHLQVQRVEGRVRFRRRGRVSAEALVGRFDKNYDDVQVEQQTWRYGLGASGTAAEGVQLDGGWRLDDAFDERATGRFDLRTQVVYGGATFTRVPKLLLRARADAYKMQRALDEWKLLVTAGAEYELLENLTLGLEYGRNESEDDIAALAYRANIWSFVVRTTLGS
jgi:hypothetical protein